MMENNILDNKIFLPLKNTGDRNKDKAPIEIGWTKDESKWYTFKDAAKRSPNVGMVTPKGYILVDFDYDPKKGDVRNGFEIALRYVKSKKLKTIIFKTKFGGHMLFKNPNDHKQTQGWPSPSTLWIDTRTPGKGQSVVQLKHDAEILGNEAGFRLYDNCPMNEISDLPDFFKPLKSDYENFKRFKTFMWKESEDGGRDASLVMYVDVLWINREMTNKKAMYQLIADLNDFIMTDRFFKTKEEIIRKANPLIEWATNQRKAPTKPQIPYTEGSSLAENQESFFGEESSDIDVVKIAEDFAKEQSIVFYKKNFWIKTEYHWYEPIETTEMYVKLVDIFRTNTFKINKENFILAMQTKEIKREESDDDIDYINTLEKRYNIKENKWEEYEGDKFFTSGINVKYNEASKFNDVDKALKTWTRDNPDEIKVLEEFIGLTLIPDNRKAKTLILYGSRAENGKSTYVKMVRNFIGAKNIAASNLTQLESKHGTADIVNKSLIVIDEMENKFLENQSNFKAIVTGENPIQVEPKFAPSYSYLPTQKIVINTNNYPKMGDNSEGVWRRIMALNFKWKYNPKKDKNFDVKSLFTTESKERILYLAIEGVKRLEKEGTWIEPEESRKLKEEFKQNNNSVLSWLHDNDIEPVLAFKIGTTMKTNFSRYVSWTRMNEYKAVGSKKFNQQIREARPDIHLKKTRNGLVPFLIEEKDYS